LLAERAKRPDMAKAVAESHTFAQTLAAMFSGPADPPAKED
jgi:hypothetical protein